MRRYRAGNDRGCHSRRLPFEHVGFRRLRIFAQLDLPVDLGAFTPSRARAPSAPYNLPDDARHAGECALVWLSTAYSVLCMSFLVPIENKRRSLSAIAPGALELAVALVMDRTSTI